MMPMTDILRQQSKSHQQEDLQYQSWHVDPVRDAESSVEALFITISASLPFSSISRSLTHHQSISNPQQDKADNTQDPT